MVFRLRRGKRTGDRNNKWRGKTNMSKINISMRPWMRWRRLKRAMSERCLGRNMCLIRLRIVLMLNSKIEGIMRSKLIIWTGRLMEASLWILSQLSSNAMSLRRFRIGRVIVGPILPSTDGKTRRTFSKGFRNQLRVEEKRGQSMRIAIGGRIASVRTLDTIRIIKWISKRICIKIPGKNSEINKFEIKIRYKCRWVSNIIN